MLVVPTFVSESQIHGLGLFSSGHIKAGSLIWEFGGSDRKVRIGAASSSDFHYGYINPENPSFIVLCGDSARCWNFSEFPNCGEEAPPTATSEARIIALRDIDPGDELTITLSSDADASRKLSLTPTPLLHGL